MGNLTRPLAARHSIAVVFYSRMNKWQQRCIRRARPVTPPPSPSPPARPPIRIGECVHARARARQSPAGLSRAHKARLIPLARGKSARARGGGGANFPLKFRGNGNKILHNN